jgi:hypothetical protein
MDTIYEERLAEFGAEYERFEADDIFNLIVRTGEWLEKLLMDEAAVDAAMTELHQRLMGAELPVDAAKGWRELWSSVSINDQLEPAVSQFLVSLSAFAFWGLPPDQCNDVPAAEAYVVRGRELLDAVPDGWGEIRDLRQTVLAAEGRLRLDTARNVTPEQLAALAQISPKTMKNMLTPKAGATEFHLNSAGEIPGADALRWLEGREDFKSSVWKETSDDADRNEDLGEVVFVPVSKDGSWFDPVRCRGLGGFSIGPKGAEERIDDYEEALDRLSRMRVPYWRRPNSVGNWGIVAGISWKRKSVEELRIAKAGEAA